MRPRGFAKGERIIEYLGERVSHDEADRRYESKDENDSHTFLFIVDSKTVIDAGVDGNDARFFNHSCDPNCESTVEKRRVLIEALRDIEPGEELTYDYQIYREDDDPENIDEVFACRCGFPNCRGTMLWPHGAEKKKRKQGEEDRRRRSRARWRRSRQERGRGENRQPRPRTKANGARQAKGPTAGRRKEGRRQVRLRPGCQEKDGQEEGGRSR